MAVEERAVKQQGLLDGCTHVRDHQRPAKVTAVLHREEVRQEDCAGVADRPQGLWAALVRRDVEAVIREWWGKRDLLHVRPCALEVVRRDVSQVFQNGSTGLQALLHALHVRLGGGFCHPAVLDDCCVCLSGSVNGLGMVVEALTITATHVCSHPQPASVHFPHAGGEGVSEGKDFRGKEK